MAHATIQTSGNRYFDILNPLPTDIFIEDIAHALSNIARFSGNTREFYSVAQHCVLCSRINPKKQAFEKLLHDAAEAYIGDLVSPIKNLFPGYKTFYKTIENRISQTVAARYDLSPGFADTDEVKRADLITLVNEKRFLFPKNDQDQFEWSGVFKNLERLGIGFDEIPIIEIDPWPGRQARQIFLETFHALCHKER